MARFDRCPNCGDEMPRDNLHCFSCDLDLQPPDPDSGSILVQLCPAATRADGFEFYRLEAARAAAFLGEIAASNLSGTLMVTYRQDGRA